MDIEKLNMLSQRYRMSTDDNEKADAFRDLNDELSEQRSMNRSMVVGSGYGDENDALSLFNMTLIRVLFNDSVRDFGRVFTKSLKNARNDFYRKEKRRRPPGMFVSLDAPRSSDDDTPISEILGSGEDIESNSLKKKETDKRQLVDFLLESATILNESVMVTAIDGIKRGETVNAIAKSLGLQRNTVDRKIQRLARNYTPKIYGDILDYFPDGVRIKQEFITA